jgi:putative MATE family efflux protein
MKTDNIAFLSEGNISKTLFRLCLPAVAAMTINGLYNVVDAFFIGLTDDTGAIGAVSVIFPLFLVITAVGVGVSIGASSFMSRSLGAGFTEKAEKTAGAALIFSFIFGALITVAGFIFMEPLLYMLGARETIMPYALSYASWILSGSVFVVANTTFAGTIRAEGNTLYSMLALLSGTILNIVLDPVFIFTCKMGIKGAAVATVISYIATFIISILYYTGKRSALKIRFVRCINKENSLEILKIGLPAMIKQLLLAAVFCIINILASSYGENSVTATGICIKIHSFVAMTLMGISQGFMPVASFNYGAGNYTRVFYAFKKILLAEVIVSGVSAILYLAFARDIVAVFCGVPVVIDIGKKTMVAFAADAVPLSIAFLADALFLSVGKANSSLLLATSRQGFIFIPVALVAKSFLGLSGILWSSAVADTICLILIACPLYAGFIRSIRLKAPTPSDTQAAQRLVDYFSRGSRKG